LALVVNQDRLRTPLLDASLVMNDVLLDGAALKEDQGLWVFGCVSTCRPRQLDSGADWYPFAGDFVRRGVQMFAPS
jgi:hypothetical protein